MLGLSSQRTRCMTGWQPSREPGSAGTHHLCCRYVILPKDFEKGYKANVKKNDHDFEFYR